MTWIRDWMEWVENEKNVVSFRCGRITYAILSRLDYTLEIEEANYFALEWTREWVFQETQSALLSHVWVTVFPGLQ